MTKPVPSPSSSRASASRSSSSSSPPPSQPPPSHPQAARAKRAPGSHPQAARAKRARGPRLALVLAVPAIALLGALAVVTLRLSRPPLRRAPALALALGATPPKPHTSFPEVESRIFQVTEATGRVEAQRGGEWVLIAPGDVLTQDNLIRTGLGRAVLKFGGTTEIELREHVDIRLDSISRAGASLDLRRGRVVAHVNHAGGRVAITSASTRTANEDGAPARFIVTADGHGHVAVATTEGTARFESAGRAVTVAAGNSARAERGQPPQDPEKISEDVFLSVSWPTGEQRDERLAISGRATRGSIVRVNGTPAEVDGTGHFTTSIPVRVGSNPIQIEAEDLSGRLKREQRDIRRIPTEAPDLVPIRTELWQK